MDCRTFRKQYVTLLDVQPDGPLAEELTRHMESCPECAAHFASIRQLVPSLKSSCPVQPPEGIKENVMNRILAMEAAASQTQARFEPRRLRLWRPLVAAGVLGVLLLIGSVLMNRPNPGPGRLPENRVLSAITLVSQAAAAEARTFTGQGLVHILNQIIVGPIVQPELAKLCWLPTTVLEETGRLNYSRLSLPSQPGKSYVINDEIWFDPATGHYARVMSERGATVFATAFDGKGLYSFVPAQPVGITRKAVAGGFKPPKNPAELLGISAGLPFDLARIKEENLKDAGTETLKDGGIVRVLKSAMATPDGKPSDNYWLFKIRESDQTIAALEWHMGETRLLAIERVRAESLPGQKVAWDLAGLVHKPTAATGQPQASLQKDMLIPDAKIEDMARRASFATYVFATSPPWAPTRTITDVLDPVSPGQRMFIITYLAKDHRHVVLVQSPSYNKLMGPLVKMSKVVYHSPNGFKVVSGPRDPWLAGILLDSARAMTHEKAAEKRTGYMLESPAGTFPALAINGPVTEAELHQLIDSLVPAKQVKK